MGSSVPPLGRTGRSPQRTHGHNDESARGERKVFIKTYGCQMTSTIRSAWATRWSGTATGRPR